jgi:hypothetical protein
MGERDPQEQLWSYQVNLDKRVRSDHRLQRVNQALDLDFVRPEKPARFSFFDTPILSCALLSLREFLERSWRRMPLSVRCAARTTVTTASTCVAPSPSAL